MKKPFEAIMSSEEFKEENRREIHNAKLKKKVLNPLKINVNNL